MTMDNYKEKIIDFIEGKIAPSEFFIWFESNSQVLDWLQSMIPQDKTIRESKNRFFREGTSSTNTRRNKCGLSKPVRNYRFGSGKKTRVSAD